MYSVGRTISCRGESNRNRVQKRLMRSSGSSNTPQMASRDRQRQRRLTVGAFMGHKPLFVLCAAVLLGGGECVSTFSTSTDMPPQAPTPNYRAIIAKSLKAKPDFYDPRGPGENTYFTNRGGIFKQTKKLKILKFPTRLGWCKQIFLAERRRPAFA